MEDVAVALGVSKATVSRAFRSHPKCSASLRERILEKARELDYQPDPLQQAHMAQLRGAKLEGMAGAVIWMLDLQPRESRLELCPSNGRFVRGARARAEEVGLKFEVFRPLDHGLFGAGLVRVLRARGIHGVVLGPMPAPHSRLEIDFSGVAAVAIGHSLEWPVFHRVSHDHYQATWDAMNHLRAEGRRRVGVAVQEGLLARVGQRWLAAHELYCRVHPDMRAAPQWTPEGEVTAARASRRDGEALLTWVRTHRLDAILTLSPWCATVLRAQGWRVPEEVAVFDLDTYPGKSDQAIPGIDQGFERMGATAVDEVVAQWGRREYGVPRQPKTIQLSGKLVLPGTGVG